MWVSKSLQAVLLDEIGDLIAYYMVVEFFGDGFFGPPSPKSRFLPENADDCKGSLRDLRVKALQKVLRSKRGKNAFGGQKSFPTPETKIESIKRLQQQMRAEAQGTLSGDEEDGSSFLQLCGYSLWSRARVLGLLSQIPNNGKARRSNDAPAVEISEIREILERANELAAALQEAAGFSILIARDPELAAWDDEQVEVSPKKGQARKK